MKLADVIDGIFVKSVSGSLELEVTGVYYDSRSVEPGGIFCALRGAGSDGHDYIDDALDKGAVAILSDRPYPAEFSATWLHVGDAREAMGLAAANLVGHPSRDLPVIGVTGTNGKTTVAFLVHHLIRSIRHRAGLIGTIHYDTGDGVTDAPRTTPESSEIQRLLGAMRDADCRGVAMEVSSHGLAQRRVAGVHFDVGVFTNLSQDHLDYHSGMEDYFASKRRLFEQMDVDKRKDGVAIVNIDDAFGERLQKARFSRLDVRTYGRSARADFRASDIRSDFNGTQFKLSFHGRSFLVRIPLIGTFNVDNAVAALASGHAIGLNLRESVAKIAEAPQVPGRLESVGERRINYRVFVDYAHTPAALTNVLETLRELEPNRIITVFGCGGDRDVTKRAPMARAAELGSDLCVLTSDNPRNEPPARILEEAAEGFERQGHEIIEDRRMAIKRAVRLAGERDIVLIAGKGHETYQEVEGVRHEFDDRRVANDFINQRAEGGSE